MFISGAAVKKNETWKQKSGGRNYRKFMKRRGKKVVAARAVYISNGLVRPLAHGKVPCTYWPAYQAFLVHRITTAPLAPYIMTKMRTLKFVRCS